MGKQRIDKNASRVTLIGPSYPFRGGIPKYTTRLAEILEAKGHLVDFITPIKQYPKWLYPGKTDQDPQSCPRLFFAKPLFSYFEPWTWKKVTSVIHSSATDRVLIPFWTKAHLPFFNYLSRHLSVPTLTILHNLFDHDSDGFGRFITRNFLKKSQHFLCHSAELLQDPLFQLPGKRICFQPLPTLTEHPSVSQKIARERFSIPPHHKVFLFFGLIRPYKGLSVLFQACKQLSSQLPFTLLIAGEPWGGLRKEVKAQLAELRNFFPCVAQLEWVPEAEVPFWFSACDSVVAPYLRATGSSVISQAIGYQRPVVTTPIGGIPEQLRDYPKAFFSIPGDPGSLCEKLVESLEAKHFSEKNPLFSPEGMWDRYVDSLIS